LDTAFVLDIVLLTIIILDTLIIMTARRRCVITLQSIMNSKSDFFKFIEFTWMAVVLYFLYDIWLDMNYITDLMYAYMQAVMDHMRH